MPLRVDVLTIFPGLFLPMLQVGMTGRALAKQLLVLGLHDLRDFTTDRHRSTDDTPYGGTAGMVLLIEPIVKALAAIEQQHGRGRRVLLSPAGRPLTQTIVHALSAEPHLVLLCGRYEGVDARVEAYVDEELSVGDFVLSGGELGALAIIDAAVRLLPGVLHSPESAVADSFEDGLLEHPHYTRPPQFEGHAVPELLLSGHHEQIRRWRRQQSLIRTARRRPDLFSRLTLSAEDEQLIHQAAATLETACD
jgi:tRNA (guanine37-N1)-methyltransferase